ncbi:MAG: hypothetical protein LBU04_05830 [Christensenellaceae bacterium]|jgi:hypothetical protein|nr:hypothetical protein [Christensenellaceae bacterium]
MRKNLNKILERMTGQELLSAVLEIDKGYYDSYLNSKELIDAITNRYTAGFKKVLLTNNKFEFDTEFELVLGDELAINCYLKGILEETQTEPVNLQIAAIKVQNFDKIYNQMTAFAKRLKYIGNQYIKNNEHFEPLSELIKSSEMKVERLQKIINESKKALENKRDTLFDLFNHTLRLVKENGRYDDFEKIIEYVLPNENELVNTKKVEITNYEFDIKCIPNFGGSEGIYLDCYLDGCFDEDTKEYKKHEFATFKTLKTDIDAMTIMGALGGAITYYAAEYVNRNIHKYTPKAELINDIKQAESKLSDAVARLDYLRG